MVQRSDLYIKIFSLVRKQAWLADFSDEIHSLLKECDDDDQVDLLSELLHKFTYLGVDEEEDAISQIVDGVIALGHPPDTIQIVALSADDDADSGQAVLYALKNQLARKKFDGVQLVNTFGKAQRYVAERRNVVLVDEFVGTGRTLRGRLAALVRDFKANKGVGDAKFFVFAYAGMREALDLIVSEGNCELVRFISILDRGITDFHVDPPAALLTMGLMEQKLLPIVHGITVPNLGDGQCEALYGRRGGNCPNSVFPVFWWPLNAQSERRSPLLVRKLP